ncbi:hypothetical protein CLV68_2740 [Actinokineospora cianjurensis]|uniref:Uncharacterized protein n=1 Tax=Actinokineospora cianjurensis TaxID=585224 RepID=A0A421BCS0_9PSEU|nr:hypothetical protein CLV68_2740 [Actinokineospora cianjurensis]
MTVAAGNRSVAVVAVLGRGGVAARVMGGTVVANGPVAGVLGR